MIQIQRPDGSWTEFYPIVSLELAGEGDVISLYNLVSLPQTVYGKYVGGAAAGNVWWVYLTLDKSQLREI